MSKDITVEDQKQFSHGGTWGIPLRSADLDLVDKIKSKTAGKFTIVDVVEWLEFGLNA